MYLPAIEKKYGISHATLNRCVLKYKTRQQGKLKGVGLSSDPMKPQPSQPPRLEQLKKLLEQERLRNKLLNAMLDIAEDELQVTIRKKVWPHRRPSAAAVRTKRSKK